MGVMWVVFVWRFILKKWKFVCFFECVFLCFIFFRCVCIDSVSFCCLNCFELWVCRRVLDRYKIVLLNIYLYIGEILRWCWDRYGNVK